MRNFLNILFLLDIFIMLVVNIFIIIAFSVNIFTIQFLGFYFYYFYYTLLKCFIGIVIFTINIMQRNKIIIKSNFMFMIPMLLASIFLIYNFIKILGGNYYEGKMTILLLLLAIGGILWIGDLILFKNDIVQRKIEKTLLCVIMPINIIVLFIIIWGMIRF